MKYVYITREIPHVAVTMLTRAGFHVTMNHNSPHVVPTKKEIIKAVSAKPYDAIVSLLTDDIDADVYDAVPHLKIVSNYAVGYNNIDITEAKKRNIAVTNTPVSNDHVAEFTLALIMAIATRLIEADAYTKAGKYKGWSPALFLGADLKGATLGLVGSGRIGHSVAEKAYKALGMNILYYDPVANPQIEKDCNACHIKQIDDLLAQSDYVSIHVPLLPQTHHLINAQRLAHMKKTAYLINTSRGPVVDETALIKTLKAGHIAGAALDVYEHEPKISKELRSLPNVILTPHIASSRASAREDMARMAAQNIIDHFNGNTPKGLIS